MSLGIGSRGQTAPELQIEDCRLQIGVVQRNLPFAICNLKLLQVSQSPGCRAMEMTRSFREAFSASRSEALCGATCPTKAIRCQCAYTSFASQPARCIAICAAGRVFAL